MSESKLRNLSMDFAVEIVNLVRELRTKHENIIANQIGRSGTSIGANIHEAAYVQGKKYFKRCFYLRTSFDLDVLYLPASDQRSACSRLFDASLVLSRFLVAFRDGSNQLLYLFP